MMPSPGARTGDAARHVASWLFFTKTAAPPPPGREYSSWGVSPSASRTRSGVQRGVCASTRGAAAVVSRSREPSFFGYVSVRYVPRFGTGLDDQSSRVRGLGAPNNCLQLRNLTHAKEKTLCTHASQLKREKQTFHDNRISSNRHAALPRCDNRTVERRSFGNPLRQPE